MPIATAATPVTSTRIRLDLMIVSLQPRVEARDRQCNAVKTGFLPPLTEDPFERLRAPLGTRDFIRMHVERAISSRAHGACRAASRVAQLHGETGWLRKAALVHCHGALLPEGSPSCRRRSSQNWPEPTPTGRGLGGRVAVAMWANQPNPCCAKPDLRPAQPCPSS